MVKLTIEMIQDEEPGQDVYTMTHLNISYNELTDISIIANDLN